MTKKRLRLSFFRMELLDGHSDPLRVFDGIAWL